MLTELISYQERRPKCVGSSDIAQKARRKFPSSICRCARIHVNLNSFSLHDANNENVDNGKQKSYITVRGSLLKIRKKFLIASVELKQSFNWFPEDDDETNTFSLTY